MFLDHQISVAAASGAIGALVFIEPKSGHSPNESYPYTPWTSGEAIMERPMAQNLGDPLTPGLPAIDDMYRGPKNLTNFASIPTQPISYNDAMHLLKHLKGKYIILRKMFIQSVTQAARMKKSEYSFQWKSNL